MGLREPSYFRKARAGVSQETPFSALGKAKPTPESSRKLRKQKLCRTRVAEHFRRGSFLREHGGDLAGPAVGGSCLGRGAAPTETPPLGA